MQKILCCVGHRGHQTLAEVEPHGKLLSVPRMMVRGVGINYDIVGEHGSWVLLIPGGRQDMELFRPLAENLAAAGYRVIIHDRRNMGYSDIALGSDPSEDQIFADDAYALCEQLGALPAIACGGAAGSRQCILFALRHPGATRCLLLWWPSGTRRAAEQLAEQYYGQYLTAAQSGGMAGVLATPYYAERCAWVPENRDRLLSMNVDEFIDTMRRWRQFFLDGADMPVIGVDSVTVRGITLPTCIVPGNDTIHPRTVAENLADLMPNAELHQLPPLERPAGEEDRRQARLDHQRRLADVFLDFLARHPA
jgi:pimeloyl-ACP methyl ester carboxylesterase